MNFLKDHLYILQNVQLEFLAFDVEEDVGCNFDYVKVYDGQDDSSTLVGRYCGDTLPAGLESTSGAVFIELVTDSMRTKNGFKVTWQPAGESNSREI